MKIVFSVAFLLVSAATLHAQAFSLPDVREGVIDGNQALLVWPTDANGDLTSPSNCFVHLRNARQHTDDDFAFPCGKWFLPPALGWYDVWVEQGNLISPYQTAIGVGDTKGAGSGVQLTEPLAPAGYVRLTAPLDIDQTLRLLSLTSPSFGFERRLSSPAAREPVRFPEGRLLAGIFASDGNAIALTRPTDLKQGETVSVSPSRPAPGTADLLLVVKRADDERTIPPDLSVSLQQGQDVRPPDVLHIAQTRLFAAWYELTPTDGTITVDGETRGVPLAAGEVTTIRTQLGNFNE